MSKLYDLYIQRPRISTDTRHIEPDSIFFALRGASFDGNRFVGDALAKGAAYAVADDASLAGTDPRIVVVDNVLESLQALAQEHRSALGIPILAISGSNGKTTTKELINRVLSKRFRTYATRGNLNNHIGVPLTLLAMDSQTEFGIVEMGASSCGEIALLTSIAQPDFGILTNVGRAHLEGFGGAEGVRRGKGELYDYLQKNVGVAFVREEDDTLREMAQEREQLQVEGYSSTLAEGIESHLEGDYNRFNIAAAVAIGHYFCVTDEEIREAISSYMPDNNRSQRVDTQHNTLIVDCYNANPSSMRASVENFLKEDLHERQRRVLILGDMLELGAWSQMEHLNIIRQALTDESARVILVGEEFEKAFEVLPTKTENVLRYPSREELIADLKKYPILNSLILIKGSRGIGLEKVVEEL